MKVATVVCNAFIGDILFASSIARELKEQLQYEKVFYMTRLIQPSTLLRCNPYIDGVNETPAPIGDVFYVHDVDQSKPVTIQFQESCGIPNPRLEYKIYTYPHDDMIISNRRESNRVYKPRPLIAVQRNWIERVYQYTPEEYWKGVDVHLKGYGGRLPDLSSILRKLNDKYDLVFVGGDPGVTQFDPKLASDESYYKTALQIKECDYMLGSEGGITNLAAGLGVKCIITTCFIAQLYGPNGLFKKIQDPKMGPATYFPNGSHSHLSPFLTEDEIVNSVIDIIDNNKPTVYDWNTLRKNNV